MEQELGLAAYFVSNEVPLEKGPRNEGLESDAEKPSSTDNEDEELVTEGRPPLLILGVASPCLDSYPPFSMALGPVCWPAALGESYLDTSLGEMAALSLHSEFAFFPFFGGVRK